MICQIQNVKQSIMTKEAATGVESGPTDVSCVEGVYLVGDYVRCIVEKLDVDACQVSLINKPNTNAKLGIVLSKDLPQHYMNL